MARGKFKVGFKAVIPFCYLVFVVFGAFYFEFCRNEIKENIHKNFYSGNLSQFISKYKITTDEITIKGVLYDVVKQEKIHDHYVVFIYADQEEMKLNQTIKNNILGKESSPNQKSKNQIIALLKQVFLPTETLNFDSFNFPKSINRTFYQFHVYRVNLTLSSPPPKNVFIL